MSKMSAPNTYTYSRLVRRERATLRPQLTGKLQPPSFTMRKEANKDTKCSNCNQRNQSKGSLASNTQ